MTDRIRIAQKWLELVESDFDMAGIALDRDKLLHCAFLLQQSAEKSLKGLFILVVGEQPPYIHDLSRLAVLIPTLQSQLSAFEELFVRLNPFYIRARYPDYKNFVSQSLNKLELQELTRQTWEVITCLKDSLSAANKKQGTS